MSNTACRTASEDPERALAIARRIPDAWFQTQALACVARYAADGLVEPLADEALRAARRSTDRYRTVAVSAWPIRALLERGRHRAAEHALAELLPLVPQVEPPSSRAEALLILWDAVFPGGAALREPALEAIIRWCDPNAHWRAARLYVWIVGTLALEDPAMAEAVAAKLPDGPAKRKTVAVLRDGVAYRPRAFF